MSINNVQLSSFVVDELFKNNLVVITSEVIAPGEPVKIAPDEAAPVETAARTAAPTPKTAAPTEAPSTGYKFLGGNKKNISILVNSPGSAFLPDNQLTFLTKILEACRMNIGDVAIINTASAPVSIGPLREQLHPTVILLFGMEPVTIKLPINFPEFRPQPYDSCTYLSSPGLSLLVENTEESKLLKSKLWVSLKTLFNV